MAILIQFTSFYMSKQTQNIKHQLKNSHAAMLLHYDLFYPD